MSRQSAKRNLRLGTALLILGIASGFAALGWLFLFFSLPGDSWDAPSAVGPLILILCAGLSVAAGVVLRTGAETALHSLAVTFLSPAEEEEVVEAIRTFESKTSGEIRVHLASDFEGEIIDEARRVFESLGMTRTERRNGVLFLVSVQDRRFAVLGDQGIDEIVPDDFWSRCVTLVEEKFAEGLFAEGLREGIAEAGEALAQHFPVQADDVNELPDEISRSE